MFRLPQKLGYVPEGASNAESGMLVFAVDEAQALCRGFKTAIPRQDLADYTGASTGQAQALYTAGIIQQFVPSDGRELVRKGVFSRSHLDGFLTRIGVLDWEDRADSASAPTACQRIGGTTADLLQAVLVGSIAAWCDPR